MGDPSDPLSLNRYVYCQLDPVNFVDPTGFMGQAIADFGRQVMNSVPHPFLRAAGTAILVVGTAIVLIESVPTILQAARDRMRPDPLAGDAPHSVYQRNKTTGKIKKYETYRKQTNPYNPNPLELEKRYDGEGKAHDGIETPHIHEGDSCRPANPDEIPGGN